MRQRQWAPDGAPVHCGDCGHDKLVASGAAFAATAQALMAEHPGLFGERPPWHRTLLPEQAQRGALASVQLMLELGWPVDVPGPWHPAR